MLGKILELTSYDKNNECDYRSPFFDFIGIQTLCRHAERSFATKISPANECVE